MFINSYNVYAVNPISGGRIMFFVEAENSVSAYVKASAYLHARFDCFFGRIDFTISEM